MLHKSSSIDLKRGVITLAFGKEEYIRMGVALGSGLQKFCPELPRAVVTDQPNGPLAELFDIVIPLNPEYGKDVIQKLYLDQYTPFESTLFIDCDCLIFGNLDYVFEGMAGGENIIPDELYFHNLENPKKGIDFALLEEKTGLKELPGFNGGVYYIEKDTLSERTFICARDILQIYPEYGIGKFRSGPNDEIVLSIAMTLVGYTQRKLPKQVMRETFGLDGKMQLDSITGNARLTCYGITYTPSIVHFCSGWRDQKAYEHEMGKLAILRSTAPGALARAHLYEYTLPPLRAFLRKLNQIGKSMWSLVPRPVRLSYYAITARLRRVIHS
ncbi:hypothetical protein [Cerasicoccus maritimus]|uniref:hypothetical protein n=1 Tax=Cerasicoccus maritimus TaxID=490089 RepID=UPI002852CEDD|nr:hypothetical protein [Cerasicoccus maritimus]